MRVRAYLHNRKEYFYPKSDSNVDMVEFYSVLEGYRLQGLEYTLDQSAGVEDIKGVEIYERDSVRVKFLEPEIIKREEVPIEVGWVEFDEGCFVVTNDDGFVWELGGTFMEAGELFQVTVIGRHPKFRNNEN